jgi:hypothetical protein
MSDQVYKTGSDVRIFLTLAVNNNFIWVDDCLGLSFSESTQKTPVFGYASRFFDAVAEGPSLITGSITIAIRAASTLSQLKSYGAIYQPQHAYPTYTEQDALKNAYWKQGTNSELGLTGSMETIHPPMAIVIAYGEYSSNAEFVVTSSKKIMDIHISNAQEGVAQDDSPLVRSYAFIGRKIVNDFGYVTPASSRSNGYDSVLAAGSSRSQDGSINWEDSDNPESHPTYETEEAVREYEESLEDIPIGKVEDVLGDLPKEEYVPVDLPQEVYGPYLVPRTSPPPEWNIRDARATAAKLNQLASPPLTLSGLQVFGRGFLYTIKQQNKEREWYRYQMQKNEGQ